MSASDLRDLRRKLNIAQRPRGSRERVQEMNVRENPCKTASAEEHGQVYVNRKKGIVGNSLRVTVLVANLCRLLRPLP